MTAVIALLSPYAPDLSATALIDAIESYDRDGQSVHYIDKHKAAARLGVSWYTLVRWAKEGRVPSARKIGTQWRFDADRLTAIQS